MKNNSTLYAVQVSTREKHC